MHWLQTLDTHLFLFVNRSLANPFFDWLMPVLSGNGGVKGAASRWRSRPALPCSGLATAARGCSW